ncbi:MAG: 50S ribosomal protein L24 [Candidatus Marinimicrobia bacterium]|nr:50S ribosomal protein L24 [Candidatus Neomarinimicrobiota bacterium]MCF7841043.1 50S ribosomal protein L24 [Candidatus Neomarinimicrobiota bacterium]MCF7903135.1 50S ribosomal protein L24 [Candidatus Neomarinimicrobiota bacterium]
MKIKKNDTVKVIAGEYRGKQGKVLAVFPDKNRVLIEGVNFVKRHQKQTSAQSPAGIIEKEAPIHLSNVQIVISDKPIRVGYKFLEDGRKVRYDKATGEIIDR